MVRQGFRQTTPTYHLLAGVLILLTSVFCFSADAYIEGPWLWMIASGSDIENDQLAEASSGTFTESLVAKHGVNEGDSVGHRRWTQGQILPEIDCFVWNWWCHSDNVNSVVNRTGLSSDTSLNDYAAYALINVLSPRDQANVEMGVGSDDSVKVWLNGEVVHMHDVSRRTTGIQDRFRINLKAGDNLLMVKVTDNSGNWGLFVDIYLEANRFTTILPTATAEVSLARHLYEKYGSTLQQPEIQAVLPTLLEELKKPEIQPFLTPLTINTAVENPDILAQFGVDAEAIDFIKGSAEVRAMLLDPDFQTMLQNPQVLLEFEELLTGVEPAPLPEPGPLPGDIDENGSVNILDLVRIAGRFGRTGPDPADVNGDGKVNIEDIILAAALMTAGAGAPSSYGVADLPPLRPEDIRAWLTEAERLDLRNPTLQTGVLRLQQLMASLTPKQTHLLANYPNPFNPETWIPYNLSEPAAVTVTIYGADGRTVRTLALGHQPAGAYQNKTRAAYWDGRNELGEPVASGVYFYTLTAGDFTATRKMVIMK